MHYLILSFTHKNTTIAVRDRLAFNDDGQKAQFLAHCQASPHVNEAFVISTCNRVETIISCKNPEATAALVYKLFSARSGLDFEELTSLGEMFEDQSAIHHLFTVASSLDSLVVGETQIAGQLKEAYRFAMEKGYCGDKLTRAINYAFRCAAEVRNAFDISSGAVSVASVAVSQAKEAFDGSLEGRTALVVGSGEMSVIAAKTLVNFGAKVTMTNRTRAKAEAIAEEIGGAIEPFEHLGRVLGDYDMLFTATSALSPIVGKGVRLPDARPRHWFDMAVPRDVDDVVHPGLKIYRVDDLQCIVDANMTMREEQARRSYGIVGRHTGEFYTWLKMLNLEPLLKELYLRADAAAETEAARAVKKGFVPAKYAEQAEKMCQQTLRRFLHPQTEQLRKVAEIGDMDAMVASLNFMLNLKEE